MRRVLAGAGMALLLLAMTAAPAAAIPDVWVEGEEVAEAEAAGTDAGFAIFLSEPSTDDVEVSFATRDVSATQPGDYTAVSGRLTIPPGDLGAIVTVPVTDDALDELDEDFALDLSDPTGATVVGESDTVTLLDDDPEPEVSISGARSVAGVATFTVWLSSPSGRAVSVQATTADGTASAPAHYTAKSERLHLPPGATRTEFQVSAPPTTAQRWFYVDLSDPQAATLGASRATGTFARRVPIPVTGSPPSLAAQNVTVLEGDTAVIGVSRPFHSPGPYAVPYLTVAGTALAGADFRAASGTATIPAGFTGVAVMVRTRYQRRLEPDETFQVRFGSEPSGATATVTIRDDRPPRVRRLRAGPAGRRLGVPVRFTLSEPARVTLRLQRRARGRWVAVPRVRRLFGHPGANQAAVRGRGLRPGVYRLVLTAVDWRGGRSTARVGVRR